MAAEEPPEHFELPLVWTGAEEVPILYANSIICQFDADLSAHLLTIGQVQPPPLIGTPEQMREQVERLDFVPVKVIARLAFTPSRMHELISVLQANVDQRDAAANLRPGDPR